MRELEEILSDIINAIDSGDVSGLATLFMELNTAAAMSGQFTDSFFGRLRGSLENPAFLRLEESWKLAYFIDSNWESLSDAQREALREVFINAFDKHRQYMGAFVIGEILGGRYGDSRALDALLRLSNATTMPALALVPHGLETLARSTADARLRDRAVQRLKELAGSTVEEVRKEAGISLGKVGRPLGPR